MNRVPFEQWIDQLREDVVQGEYGYERGEFTVFPDHWRSQWREGLTPAQAFKRALDEHGAGQRQDEVERKANWARIQAEDAAYIAAWAARSEAGGA